MRIQGIDQTLKAEKKEAKDLDNNFSNYKKTLYTIKNFILISRLRKKNSYLQLLQRVHDQFSQRVI